MQMEARHGDSREGVSDHLLRSALASQSTLWPDVRTELGAPEPGWITAEGLFADDAAIEEYLDYEGAFHGSADRKTCAAAMIVDYCYIFSIATVPLFAGFGIVPDLSPSLFALQFYIAPREHDGRILEVRRAHIRYLSSTFSAGGKDNIFPPNVPTLTDHDLCSVYRTAVEMHFYPLVTVLHARTGLPRNALWRLVADAIAGRFLDAGRRFDRLEPAKELAMDVLKKPGSPLHNRDLHYFDLALHDNAQRELLTWTFRARGGCCRFYTIEGGKLCSTCVLKNAAERDNELLDAMRRQLSRTTDDAA